MSRHPKRTRFIKRVAMLVTIPLVLTSTGYALFSQSLSVNTTSNKPAYSSSQNLDISYTKSIASQGQKWQYTIDVTVTNNGTASVTSWQSTFSLPADYSNVSCSSASCSQAGNVNTASGSNTIAAGAYTTYTLVFRSSDPAYLFTSIGVSGTQGAQYQTYSGLTVNAVAGTRTKKGKTYSWPYTFTVTNNSGQNLSGWRIVVPWNTSASSVSNMPATVNYVENPTQLTIYSTQALNNGSNFQFVATFSSSNQNWVMSSGYYVEGEL